MVPFPPACYLVALETLAILGHAMAHGNGPLALLVLGKLASTAPGEVSPFCAGHCFLVPVAKPLGMPKGGRAVGDCLGAADGWLALWLRRGRGYLAMDTPAVTLTANARRST